MTESENAHEHAHHGHPDLAGLRAPGPWLLALEWRAPWEFGAVLPAWPLLQMAPEGDGHPVVVFPGLSASDSSTIPLRRYLASLRHDTHGWTQGFNFGPRAGVLSQAMDHVKRLVDHNGRKASLLGWSLGGVYAREIAKELPDHVRGVITLGTPFSGPPRSTNAWRIYEVTSGRRIQDDATRFRLHEPPPVPTTSIYSRTDGIVAWQGSVQRPVRHNPHTENIEVVASHIGIGLNPSTWWAVADRLAQPEGAWQPFRPPRIPALGALLYPDPSRRAD